MKKLLNFDLALIKFFAVLMFVVGFSGIGYGATLTVTKTADTNDGVCDADCSLREAIAAADVSAGDDEIIFQAGLNDVFAVTLGELKINSNLIITGTIPNRLTIAGNNNGSIPGFRIFNISPDSSVTINNLIIKGGSLRSDGSAGSSIYGGGIYNQGNLFLSNTTITENVLTAAGQSATAVGAGIYNSGSLSLFGSTVSGNMTVCLSGTNCLNSENGTGGGIASNGSLLLTDSEVVNNVVKGGLGQNNPGVANGGGLAIIDGTASLMNSTVNGNSAAARSAKGGGISNNGFLTITKSTISGNSANRTGATSFGYGGGIYNSDTAAISNTTIGLNLVNGSSLASGILPASSGGGVYNLGTMFLSHSTIAGNRSNSVQFATQARAAGISNQGTVNLSNTIISSNQSPVSSDFEGAAASQGNNLIGRTLESTGWVDSDLLNRNSLLAPLENYGGFTRTFALLPGSPAINSGNNMNAPNVDQRGSARIVEDSIDIGALENNIKILPDRAVLGSAAGGTNYSEVLTANRLNPSQPSSFSFSIISGSLPPGLTLAENGTISGFTTSSGNFIFTVKASDTDGIAGAREYTISVNCTYSLSPGSQNFGTQGGSGTIVVTTQNGCTWSGYSLDFWLNPILSNPAGGTLGFSALPNSGAARTGRIMVDNQIFIVNQAGNNLTGKSSFDFDGDGKADISVFRPANGSWYVQQSTAGFTGVAFGFGTDKLIPADYDGDGKTDVAVYRNGTWYIQRSSLGFYGVAFGAADDIPVPADYDGDGKADIAVFRPSNGTWYVQQSSAGFTGIAFGQNGDKPVAADYDGDGKADVAVNRNGIWYINRSQLGFYGIQFGDSNDKLVPADYDGDGKTDIAVFRPSNGTWYLQQSTAGFTGVAFGLGTDTPVAADYDGDGKADVAVVREGTWYLNRSTAGFTGIQFGTSTDLPVPNTFVR